MKLNLGRFVDIERKEKDFSLWVSKRKYRIALVGMFSVMVLLLRGLPYFNLVLDVSVSLLVVSVFLVFVLDISERAVFGIGLVFLLFAIPFSVFGWWQQAEVLGNFVYGLFF